MRFNLRKIRETIIQNADWICKHCGLVCENFEEAKKHESTDENGPHHIRGEISVLSVFGILKEQEGELREMKDKHSPMLKVRVHTIIKEILGE